MVDILICETRSLCYEARLGLFMIVHDVICVCYSKELRGPTQGRIYSIYSDIQKYLIILEVAFRHTEDTQIIIGGFVLERHRIHVNRTVVSAAYIH